MLRKRAFIIVPVGQEAEAFENGSIPELVCVFDQFLVAAISSFEIGAQTVGDLLDAAAQGGIVEHIDDGPVYIRNRHLSVMPPDGLGTEDLLRLHMFERKIKAMPLLLLRTDGLTSDHNDVFEYLLGKVPMLGSGTASDIGWREKRRHENPAIIKNTFRTESIDGRRNVSTSSDPT